VLDHRDPSREADLGLLLTRLNEPNIREWVRTGPTTTCSDGPERTVVRLSLVE
jgi:hypothetical protein